MEITVTSSSPQMAKSIVNEVSAAATLFIGDKMEVIPPQIVEEGVLRLQYKSEYDEKYNTRNAAWNCMHAA